MLFVQALAVPLLAWAALNGGLHFVTDFITSKTSRYFYDNGKMRLFWVVIGADQMVHMLCLIISALLLF